MASVSRGTMRRASSSSSGCSSDWLVGNGNTGIDLGTHVGRAVRREMQGHETALRPLPPPAATSHRPWRRHGRSGAPAPPRSPRETRRPGDTRQHAGDQRQPVLGVFAPAAPGGSPCAISPSRSATVVRGRRARWQTPAPACSAHRPPRTPARQSCARPDSRLICSIGYCAASDCGMVRITARPPAAMTGASSERSPGIGNAAKVRTRSASGKGSAPASATRRNRRAAVLLVPEMPGEGTDVPAQQG